jgi:hypothetical protein
MDRRMVDGGWWGSTDSPVTIVVSGMGLGLGLVLFTKDGSVISRRGGLREKTSPSQAPRR